MNTHRAVRQFLAKEENKTELKSERIQLNVVENIKKTISKMEKAEKTLTDLKGKALDAFERHENGLLKAYERSLDDKDKLMDKLKSNQDILSEAKKVIASAEKGAKDLGLQPKDIPNYNILQSQIDQYPKEFNSTSATIDRIDKAKI